MIPVVLIKGDGIGPEISQAIVDIFAAARIPITWIEKQAGINTIGYAPNGLPVETMQAVKQYGIALKGPTTTPVGSGHKSVNVTLRKAFELFANVRPCKSLPGVKTRFEFVDLVIVRENIEDTYGGIEHKQTSDVAQGLKLITRPGSIRIAKYAFEMARRTGRKRVTAAHKANIHKLTDGLFLECFQEVAAEYPEIKSDDIIVDNLCMQLVSNPEKFDVICLPNLMGDIVSDLSAGLIGGLGVAPGGNIGENCAIFESVHGSAPDIAGKGIANPTALLLSSVQMLRHLGLKQYASSIEEALIQTMKDGVKTGDLGGKATTKEFTEAVIERLPAEITTLNESPQSFSFSMGDVPIRKPLKAEWIGADVFVEHSDGLPKVPEKVGHLRLKMISNRGTKVYPGEMPDIYLVDHHRCRYYSVNDQGEELYIIDDDILELLRELRRRDIKWMHIEKLQRFDGKEGYSKAQGE